MILFLIVYPEAERYSCYTDYFSGQHCDAFNLSQTGFIWIIYLVLVGGFEYLTWTPAPPNEH